MKLFFIIIMQVAILATGQTPAVSLTWVPSTTPNATTTVTRNGQAIVSGLTVASYIDSTVAAGKTYTYNVTGVLGGATSAPSNPFIATIPPALAPTTVTITTSPANAYLDRISVAVTANSGSGIPQGVVSFSIQGTIILNTTLDKKGQTSTQLCMMLLKFLPVTVTYTGSSTFASSSASVGGPQ